jgi:hypothetical protein
MTWKKIENTWNRYSKTEITKEEAQQEINTLIEESHPIKKRVILIFDKNDRPEFDQIEIEETKSAESYFVILLSDAISMKLPANTYTVADIESFLH